MGRGGEYKYMQGFGDRTWSKEALVKPTRTKKDTIKMDLK